VGGGGETRRTVGDGGYEAVDRDGSVEHHLGPHGLPVHEITARCSEKVGKRAGRRSHLRSSRRA